MASIDHRLIYDQTLVKTIYCSYIYHIIIMCNLVHNFNKTKMHFYTQLVYDNIILYDVGGSVEN